ncbi:MAG: DUF2892 domain-containing protein [Halioglobus sp.]|nr:DUF2892 domain-containing protein [Halioglobus sp.]
MKNEGTLDRVIRVVLGLALLSLVFVGPQTPWGYVGLVPLLTGLVGFCPLYRIFGLNTCPLRNDQGPGKPAGS